jgi:hypothetical protein
MQSKRKSVEKKERKKERNKDKKQPFILGIFLGVTYCINRHSCLYLERSLRSVAFIGTPTAGSNGNVTNISLPGGVLVSFTALGRFIIILLFLFFFLF